MTLHDLKWSPSEKRVAREAFDFGSRIGARQGYGRIQEAGGAVATPSDLWEIEDYLRQQRREIDETFDYRYSRLLLVFARLIREGHLDESRLAGLSGEKREILRSFLSLAARE